MNTNNNSNKSNSNQLPSLLMGGAGGGSFLIGAATSNSGKTTFTMGLLRALRNRGYNIQPYKCGPDYIDTMFHHLASGNESINLDSFMSSEEHIKELFEAPQPPRGASIRVDDIENTIENQAPARPVLSSKASQSERLGGAGGSIVEGVMGLFDGYDKSKGSSAEIAMLLDIPVILVVNAKSVAYSVAPLIHGFKTFNPKLKLAGVVFNMVASENHYKFLKDACEDAGVVCLGYMQKNPNLNIPGRHLGLTISAKEEMEMLINLAAEEVEKHVDLAPLCPLGHLPRGGERHPESMKLENPQAALPLGGAGRGAWSIAIANDEAFNFTYKANIDSLSQLGEVRFFSPLNDSVLPSCDLLYIPGGYPELFLDQLSSNVAMLHCVKAFAEQGGRIYAECGGFMYLCNNIDGTPLCDVLPLQATMQNARLHLGYRSMMWNGKEIRGHEFHYSEVVPQEMPDSVQIFQLQSSSKGTVVSTPIYRYKNVIAGYTHWYWAEQGFPFFALE